MTADRRAVALFGLLGVGNFGNDGSFEAVLNAVRRVAPHERVICVCGNPAEIERNHGIDAVPIYYNPKDFTGSRLLLLLRKMAGKAVLGIHALRHLRRIKVLIVPGMGILDDFGTYPFAWPLDIMVWFGLARLMGVKVMLVSVGAGPIHNPLSRLFMKTAARSAHYRSYRDRPSKDFMGSIGLDVTNDRVYPDVAFGLPAPDSTTSGQAPLTVGVGVMTYFRWNQDAGGVLDAYNGYIAKMAAYVEWLLDQGHRVRVMIGEESDTRAVEDLFELLRGKSLESLEERVAYRPVRNIHDVLESLADVDLAVTTRYHNVISALKMDRPTISIGYAAKNDILLADVGLADFCQHIERLDLDLLKSQTERLIAERATLVSKVREVRARYRERLHDQDERIASMIREASK